jgi:hypothetical protein
VSVALHILQWVNYHIFKKVKKKKHYLRGGIKMSYNRVAVEKQKQNCWFYIFNIKKKSLCYTENIIHESYDLVSMILID